MKITLILLCGALMVLPHATARPPAETQARVEAWIKHRPGGIALACATITTPPEIVLPIEALREYQAAIH